LSWIRSFFVFVGIVEFVIGTSFLIMADKIFYYFNISPVNHIEHVQFTALLIMVFGLMMFNVAADPARNRNLIFYCILFKIAFCSVTFYYWFFANLSWLWIVFAGFDLVYTIGFILALRVLPIGFINKIRLDKDQRSQDGI